MNKPSKLIDYATIDSTRIAMNKANDYDTWGDVYDITKIPVTHITINFIVLGGVFAIDMVMKNERN